MKNNKEELIKEIESFLSSREEERILITGTHQYEKHKTVMRYLNKNRQGCKVLFTINGMSNITDDAYIGLKRQPKIGERVRIGNNYYTFCTFLRPDSIPLSEFDYCIVYPIDYLEREKKIDVLKKICNLRVSKTFFISWTDRYENYSHFDGFYQRHAIYDAKEEDEAYHNRVLENINKKLS